MRKSVKIVAALGFASLVTVTTTLGQPLLRFDEYGNSLWAGAPGPPGVVLPDPLSGIPTLSYALPPGILGNPGDIVLFEDSQHTIISDVIRFPGNGRFWFFSDQNDAPEPGVLADAPFPPLPGPLPMALFTEVGPELGPNGLFGYVPGAGGIGGDPAFPTLTYDFISDGVVPEPNSLMLLLNGVGILAGFNLLRRKNVS